MHCTTCICIDNKNISDDYYKQLSRVSTYSDMEHMEGVIDHNLFDDMCKADSYESLKLYLSTHTIDFAYDNCTFYHTAYRYSNKDALQLLSEQSYEIYKKIMPLLVYIYQ